jgi:putative nucleotidyltransferase with HDIG domain
VPGSLGHLAQRFFDVLLARPLTDAERATVEGWVDQAPASLFFSQSDADQRHGYHAATVVQGSLVSDPTVIRAALLHDVGKRHSGLGVIGRTIASLLIRLHLPLTRRVRIYRDHGAIGSTELAALGCEPLIVDFARHHHGHRPETIEPGIWEILQLADQPPKTVTRFRSRIT